MTRDIVVLFVAEYAALRDLTAEMLERAAPTITVRTEANPDAVCDRMADEAIDCVVSDYQMPRMDGLQLCELIRADHPDVPFILFTSNDDLAGIQAALGKGVTDYVLKRPGIEHFELLADRIETAVRDQCLQIRPLAVEATIPAPR